MVPETKKVIDFDDDTPLEDIIDEVLGEYPDVAFLTTERRSVIPSPKKQKFTKYTANNGAVGFMSKSRAIAVIPKTQSTKIAEKKRLVATVGGFEYPIRELALALRQFARSLDTDLKIGMMGDGKTASPLVLENEELRVFITPTSALDALRKEQEAEDDEEDDDDDDNTE